jgi:hypothetical protein
LRSRLNAVSANRRSVPAYQTATYRPVILSREPASVEVYRLDARSGLLDRSRSSEDLPGAAVIVGPSMRQPACVTVTLLTAYCVDAEWFMRKA